MRIFLLILFLLIGLNSSISAQLHKIPINQQAVFSDLIIEGKVIDQKYYYGSDDLIYTANLVEINQIIKGEIDLNSKQIFVITRGGIIDGKSESWTHLLELSKNDTGIFFLESFKTILTDLDSQLNQYSVFSSNQGFYKFTDLSNKYVSNAFERKLHVDNLFTDDIKSKNSIKYTAKSNKNCINYSIETKLVNIANATNSEIPVIEYSIYANMDFHEAALFSTNLNFRYDSDILGEYIVTSSKFTAENSTSLNNLGYSLNFRDLASDQIELNLQSNNDFLLIPVQKILLLTGYIQIDNLEALPNFLISDEDLQFETTLYGDRPIDADCQKVFINRTCPIVDDFFPKIAAGGVGTQSENGIEGTITIIGSNFDDLDEDERFHPDEYRVGFTDVPTEGWMFPPQRDYISWNNNTIQVRVPSLNENGSQGAYAGTGKVAVFKINEDDCFDASDVDLYVPFSARNSPIQFSDGTIQSIRTKMSDRDTEGGYEILLENSYLTIDPNGKAFERALETWQCNVAVNFKLKTVDEVNNFNFICSIILDSTLPIGVVSSTLASTNVGPLACVDGTLDHSFLPNFSIRFNSFITDENTVPIPIIWHTDIDPLPPFLDELPEYADLETVALHELGHGLLLRHTLNEKNVMHKGQLPTRRTLDVDDFNGGDHTVKLSIADPNCQGNMTPFDCSTNAVFNLLRPDLNYVVYPNPVENVLKINYEKSIEGYYTVKDVHGREMFNTGTKSGHLHSFDLSALNSGIYYISFLEKETKSIITIKIIKL